MRAKCSGLVQHWLQIYRPIRTAEHFAENKWINVYEFMKESGIFDGILLFRDIHIHDGPSAATFVSSSFGLEKIKSVSFLLCTPLQHMGKS